MRLISFCLLLVVASCGGSNGDSDDAGASRDLSLEPGDPRDGGSEDLSASQPDLLYSMLCTTPACAAKPCTTNCVFSAASDGKTCPMGQAGVGRAMAEACPYFCGFLQWPDYGCLRFRSEVPICNQECLPWSDPRCLDWTPKGDYQRGGAICDSDHGYFCDQGPAPDLAFPCPDGGR